VASNTLTTHAWKKSIFLKGNVVDDGNKGYLFLCWLLMGYLEGQMRVVFGLENWWKG
jgi:hypothetical protein